MGFNSAFKGLKNILAIKSTCTGCMLVSGWLFHCVPEMVRIYEGLKRAGEETRT
jgi:hypothetical protein